MSKGRSNGPHKHCECEPFRCGTRLFLEANQVCKSPSQRGGLLSFVYFFGAFFFFIGASLQFDSHDTTSIGMNRMDIV
jgi:hypothetical protein